MAVDFDDMPPEAALMLLIIYHNGGQMTGDAMDEALVQAVTEYGSVEAALEAYRTKTRPSVQ